MFKPAHRRRLNLKIMIVGPSGAGATLTALLWAKEIADGRPVAVFDTRVQGSDLYVGWPDGRGGELAVDVFKATDNQPSTYRKAIEAACDGGYGCLVIDSLSDAWGGVDGVLELVDTTSNGGGWKKWGPVAKKMHAMIQEAPIHIIVTMRAKIVHAPTTGTDGRPAMTKLASTPIQTDGLEYGYTLVAELDRPEEAKVHGYFSKTLVSSLRGISFSDPGPSLAKPMLEWASAGDVVTETTEAPNPTQPQAPAQPGGDILKQASELQAILAGQDQAWGMDQCLAILPGLVERRQSQGKTETVEEMLFAIRALSQPKCKQLIDLIWSKVTNTPTPAK